MFELKGKYTNAIVYSNDVDNGAVAQIIQLCNMEWLADSKVRIMPDYHAGKGCVIGTTVEVSDKIVPNFVGVDIGCGVSVVPLKDKHIEFLKIDKFIHQNVPSGVNVHRKSLPTEWDLDELRCIKAINPARTYQSIGSLGGGNHYIEIGKDDEGGMYLSVHSGSRNLGHQVATHYQHLCDETDKKYLTGGLFDNYMHDMKLVQEYASINRQAILDLIIKGCGLSRDRGNVWNINTAHNYVDTTSMILRKGAVSAKDGEKLVIPMNMRDGSLLAVGKGNPEWNNSSPHGAGRLYSRTKAKETLTMEEFKSSMKGIYTSTLNSGTLDESPMAYKDMSSIVEYIRDTVTIDKRIVPVYNFKSAEK